MHVGIWSSMHLSQLVKVSLFVAGKATLTELGFGGFAQTHFSTIDYYLLRYQRTQVLAWCRILHHHVNDIAMSSHCVWLHWWELMLVLRLTDALRNDSVRRIDWKSHCLIAQHFFRWYICIWIECWHPLTPCILRYVVLRCSGGFEISYSSRQHAAEMSEKLFARSDNLRLWLVV